MTLTDIPADHESYRALIGGVANKIRQNRRYLLAIDDAGRACGYVTSPGDALRPALEIMRTRPGRYAVDTLLHAVLSIRDRDDMKYLDIQQQIALAIVYYLDKHCEDPLRRVTALHVARKHFFPTFTDNWEPLKEDEVAIEIINAAIKRGYDRIGSLLVRDVPFLGNAKECVEQLLVVSETPQDPEDPLWTAVDIALAADNAELAHVINHSLERRHRGNGGRAAQSQFPAYREWHDRLAGGKREKPAFTMNGYNPRNSFRVGAVRLEQISELAKEHATRLFPEPYVSERRNTSNDLRGIIGRVIAPVPPYVMKREFGPLTPTPAPSTSNY